MSFKENFSKIEADVKGALTESNREGDSVKILAISKTVPIERVADAYAVGCRCFGESRVQEFELKKNGLPEDIEWHFIGHLQTNKVKKIVGGVDLVHSVDSVRLAEALNSEAQKQDCKVPILMQINISRETTKFGFDLMEVESVLDQMQKLSALEFRGLMAIGPWFDDEVGAAECQKVFASLRELKDKISNRFDPKIFKELSMGMSHDFKIAIKEGSTMIRVGTSLFGERDYA